MGQRASSDSNDIHDKNSESGSDPDTGRASLCDDPFQPPFMNCEYSSTKVQLSQAGHPSQGIRHLKPARQHVEDDTPPSMTNKRSSSTSLSPPERRFIREPRPHRQAGATTGTEPATLFQTTDEDQDQILELIKMMQAQSLFSDPYDIPSINTSSDIPPFQTTGPPSSGFEFSYQPPDGNTLHVKKPYAFRRLHKTPTKLDLGSSKDNYGNEQVYPSPPSNPNSNQETQGRKILPLPTLRRNRKISAATDGQPPHVKTGSMGSLEAMSLGLKAEATNDGSQSKTEGKYEQSSPAGSCNSSVPSGTFDFRFNIPSLPEPSRPKDANTAPAAEEENANSTSTSATVAEEKDDQKPAPVAIQGNKKGRSKRVKRKGGTGTGGVGNKPTTTSPTPSLKTTPDILHNPADVSLIRSMNPEEYICMFCQYEIFCKGFEAVLRQKRRMKKRQHRLTEETSEARKEDNVDTLTQRA